MHYEKWGPVNFKLEINLNESFKYKLQASSYRFQKYHLTFEIFYIF